MWATGSSCCPEFACQAGAAPASRITSSSCLISDQTGRVLDPLPIWPANTIPIGSSFLRFPFIDIGLIGGGFVMRTKTSPVICRFVSGSNATQKYVRPDLGDGVRVEIDTDFLIVAGERSSHYICRFRMEDGPNFIDMVWEPVGPLPTVPGVATPGTWTIKDFGQPDAWIIGLASVCSFGLDASRRYVPMQLSAADVPNLTYSVRKDGNVFVPAFPSGQVCNCLNQATTISWNSGNAQDVRFAVEDDLVVFLESSSPATFPVVVDESCPDPDIPITGNVDICGFREFAQVGFLHAGTEGFGATVQGQCCSISARNGAKYGAQAFTLDKVFDPICDNFFDTLLGLTLNMYPPNDFPATISKVLSVTKAPRQDVCSILGESWIVGLQAWFVGGGFCLPVTGPAGPGLTMTIG